MAPLTVDASVAGYQSALMDVTAHQLEQSAVQVDHQAVDQSAVVDHLDAPPVVDQADQAARQHAGAMVDCHCDAPVVV